MHRKFAKSERTLKYGINYRGKKSSRGALKLKYRRLYAEKALLRDAVAYKPRADPKTGKFKSGRPKRLIPKVPPKKRVSRSTGAKIGRPKKIVDFEVETSEQTMDGAVGVVEAESMDAVEENFHSSPSVTIRKPKSLGCKVDAINYQSSLQSINQQERTAVGNQFVAGDLIVCKSGKFRTAQGKVKSVDEEFLNLELEDFADENRVNFAKVHFSTVEHFIPQ